MTEGNERINLVEEALARGNGILRLKPAWVARTSMPPGGRLGLSEEQYTLEERGWITERWLASTTLADNRAGPPDEGLSYLQLPAGAEMTLQEAVRIALEAILGAVYAKNHTGLGRLVKIFDYSDRLAYHLHQRKADAARVGRNPKEEAYYFLENVDMGRRPETFFGVHPSIVEQEQYEVLLPHLVEWKDDLILKHSRAYRQAPGEGFHVPAGVPHAPGTALTLELQEDSDVFAVLQAWNAGRPVPKEMLFKDVHPQDRQRYGERVILKQIDWQTSGDPYFYENRRLLPVPIEGSQQEGGQEQWVFYNTPKFSGKKLVLQPGEKFSSVERGVYSLLVWQGSGLFDGLEVLAGDTARDELLVCHARAVQPLLIENTGSQELVIFKFFGPDVNPDAPVLPMYGGKGRIKR
jgi:mannose-6-phosphate isomerase class I